ERALLNNRLDVMDLPDAWSAKMQEYLGVTPPDHRVGVLQDVHWAAGLVGYFPTYTLGNIISGQLRNSMVKSIGELEPYIAKGEFQPILDWMRTNIHSKARIHTPKALVELATSEKLNAAYYVDYLKSKFGAIYEL
ncbi:MAG: carboxypeptidase M32, partial [Chthonomonadales bacterium]